jgi:predicted DNA-binding transcriptional regulator AlpA
MDNPASLDSGIDRTERVPALIDADTITQLLKVSRRTLERLVHDGEFPKPLHIGVNARWRASDYAAYVERLAAKAQRRR